MHVHDIRAYEGKEPYIFISYAHKDADRVLPILKKLQEDGYRVWYDEGIAPGSEWPENIAQHLNDCAVTIAMVSANSMDSANCRREITYALSKKKPFLGIFLEETAMSPGMELQMSAQQCLMKYSYRSEALFYEKVASCPDLAPCKQAPAPLGAESVPASVVVPTHEKPAAAEKTPTKPGKKLWIPIAAASAVVALVLVILLAAGGGNGDTPTDPHMNTSSSDPTSSTAPTKPTEPTTPTDSTDPSDSTQSSTLPTGSTIILFDEMIVDIDETHLYLYSRTIDADTLQKINKLSKLKSLSLTECQFDTDTIDILGHTSLELLYLENCTGITDFSFLASYTQINVIHAIGCGVTDDAFPALTQETIYRVNLNNNPAFTDLTKLSGLSEIEDLDISGTGISSLDSLSLESIYCLDFSNTAVSDISCLSNSKSMYEIIGKYTNVTDLSPLAELENLTRINFSYCNISAITAPFYSFDLSEVYLYGCGLTDISGLAHLAELRYVDLGENQLPDVRFLQKSADKLTQLSVAGNPVSEENIGFLSECANLTLLYISGIPIGNLDICSNLTALRYLEAKNCALTDISGLQNCTALEQIVLAQNSITDISALGNLTSSYVKLDLAWNNLTDVSALADVHYRILCLAYNDSLDPSTITVSGNTLYLDCTDNLAESLATNFYYYGIIHCPIDQMAAILDKFGKNFVIILDDEAAFRERMAEHGFYYFETT